MPKATPEPHIFREEAFNEEEINLEDLWETIKRRKIVIVSFLVVVLLAVGIYTIKTTPIFKATTKIIIEQQQSSLIDLGKENDISTWVELLRSRQLALEVIKKVGLDSILEERHQKRTFLASIFPFLHSEVKDKPLDEQAQKDTLINWYLSNLKISTSKNSRIVNISFLDSSPEIAARTANAHAQTFIKRYIELQQSEAEQILQWLQQQLRQQRKKLEEARQELYRFQKENNIVSLGEKQNIIYQKIQELNTLLIQAKTDRIAKENAYRQLQKISANKGEILSLPEVTATPMIQKLREELTALKAEYRQMAASYGPKHPKMIELSEKIKQVQKELQIEINRLRKSIKADLDRAKALEASLQKALEEQKKLALQLNQKMIKYEELKQEIETNQRMYDLLFKQASEVKLMSATQNNNVRIVDPAEPPLFPIKPKILLNLAVAILTGLFGGIFLAFFFEFLDNTVKSPEDIQKALGLSLLGILPYDENLKEKIVSLATKKNISSIKSLNASSNPGNPRMLPVENYKQSPVNISGRLPAIIQREKRGYEGQVFSITSSLEAEGKTTTLSTIAYNLSRMGYRCVLVDCDFYKPALGTFFNLKKQQEGLSEAILEVLSYKLTTGSLSEISVADIFFIISLQSLSGKLTITSEDLEIYSYFKEGNLYHIEQKDSPDNLKLGNILLKSGLITQEQLDHAMEHQKHTLKPLGYILTQLGYISLDKLKGHVILQVEGYLQKMFTIKAGHFSFDPKYSDLRYDYHFSFEQEYRDIIEKLYKISSHTFLEKALFSRILELPERNLYLLPAGPASHIISHQGLNIRIFSKFLELLKNKFHIVLLDTPPIINVPEGMAIQTLADATIFVVKAGDTPIKIIKRAYSDLLEADIKILGAIINQLDSKEYYYYYSYYKKKH